MKNIIIFASLLTYFTTISQISGFYPVNILQEKYDPQFCNLCGHCDTNKNNIRTLTGYDVKKSPIEKNNYKVGYLNYSRGWINQTYNLYNQQIYSTSRYVLFLPNVSSQNFKGVISYFHPTVFNKTNVPSSLTDYYLGIAGFYGAQGFAVMMIDQIGLGADFQNIHPYVLFPFYHVQTMSMALNQTYQLLNNTYKKQQIKIYPVGYSEGGSYSLWFGYCQQKKYDRFQGCQNYKPMFNKYSIAKIAGLQGAYDLKGTVMPFLQSKVTKQDGNTYRIQKTFLTNLIKPGLTAMAFVSYNKYSSQKFLLSSWFNDDFFKMKCEIFVEQKLCNVNQTTNMNIQQAFKQPNLPQSHFALSFGYSALDKSLGYDRYLRYNQLLSARPPNSVNAIIKQEKLNSSSILNATLRAGSNFNNVFQGLKNSLLFTLQKDSVVSPDNTYAMSQIPFFVPRKVFFKNGDFFSCKITGSLPEEVDHLGAEYIAHIYALKYFTQ